MSKFVLKEYKKYYPIVFFDAEQLKWYEVVDAELNPEDTDTHAAKPYLVTVKEISKGRYNRLRMMSGFSSFVDMYKYHMLFMAGFMTGIVMQKQEIDKSKAKKSE